MQQPTASPAAVTSSEQAGYDRPEQHDSPSLPTGRWYTCSAAVFRERRAGEGGRTNARAACLSLALTWLEQDVPYSVLLLTWRYGKSSLLRRGNRWLAYLRVVGGCYIDRCLDGGSWRLTVGTLF